MRIQFRKSMFRIWFHSFQVKKEKIAPVIIILKRFTKLDISWSLTVGPQALEWKKIMTIFNLQIFFFLRN